MKATKNLLIGVVAFLLVAGAMFAQSNGNFTYGNTGGTHCVLNKNGSITGGATCSQSSVCTAAGCTIVPGSTDCAGSLSAGIKTNSGAGNVFVIRPSGCDRPPDGQSPCKRTPPSTSEAAQRWPAWTLR